MGVVGFAECPGDFHISRYAIDKDEWVEATSRLTSGTHQHGVPSQIRIFCLFRLLRLNAESVTMFPW